MSAIIHQVDNANVYLNGVSFIGKTKSVKLPEFNPVMIEHKNLGLVGTINLPSGVEALEGEIVWDGYYPEAMAIALNPFKTVQLMVRGNVRVFNATGRVAEVPLVVIINGSFSKIGNGEYKQNEAAEYAMTYKAHSIKATIDGKEVLYYNAFTNEYRVASEDVLSQYRKNVGQ
ncbi:phage major tail tube protein [Glaesserella parasuis]|nr:phage major tail tube protein [Glaesserella parasuis]MDP0302524.1 phage major tail tube protein [Glaesserella parasuis]